MVQAEIQEILSLDSAPAAHDLLESGGVYGRVVLKP
jgi:D-arabinose 1-dehydrogenase-like Zn-dependent alcohol dehydrogenase